MLSEDEIRRIAAKNQATEDKVAREYAQNIILSRLYQKKGTEHLLFKGGTALRIVYGSPRYSEDLDFTATKVSDSQIKSIIEETIGEIEKEGFVTETEYNKTSGGWLIVVQTKASTWPIRIEFNISTRGRDSKGEYHLITSPYTPPYSLNALSEETLVAEKVDALLNRKKPRDYFDLYYIIRSQLEKKPLIEKKQELLKAVEILDDQKTKRELKTFLPPTYWPTLANLKNNLKKELTRV